MEVFLLLTTAQGLAISDACSTDNVVSENSLTHKHTHTARNSDSNLVGPVLKSTHAV